jgi:hypothetical protein
MQIDFSNISNNIKMAIRGRERERERGESEEWSREREGKS